MISIFNLLETLRSISGNAQIQYLSDNKNELLRQVLEYTYDPHKKYKIDEGKYNKLECNTETQRVLTKDSWYIFTSMLDELSNKKSATDLDVKKIVDFINQFNDYSQYFLKRVLFKDLRLNMSIKKFQKVWNDFCVEPQVQLAMDKSGRDEFINGMYSRKFDGKRMYIEYGIPYSRSNNKCYTQPIQHILDQIKTLNLNDYVLDGECIYFEEGKENFQKGISLCQSEKRQEGCDNICYVIFDIIPISKFNTKHPYIPFKEEYKLMLDMLSDTNKISPDYSLIPTIVPNVFIARQDVDPTELIRLRTDNRWEGLMYRNADACYEYKRTSNLLKIKSMKDMELQLVQMEEGTGKYAGKLGAFILRYKDSFVRMGSGFTDEQRIEYWNNKNKYIGLTVKVQYFEETQSQDGKPSLRFPVFLCFRDLDTNEEFFTIC